MISTTWTHARTGHARTGYKSEESTCHRTKSTGDTATATTVDRLTPKITRPQCHYVKHPSHAMMTYSLYRWTPRTACRALTPSSPFSLQPHHTRDADAEPQRLHSIRAPSSRRSASASRLRSSPAPKPADSWAAPGAAARRARTRGVGRPAVGWLFSGVFWGLVA